mgnify:CR=1 FL=1
MPPSMCESKLQAMRTESDQPEPASDCLHQYDHRKNRDHDNANERSRFELGPIRRVTENRSTVRQDQNENQDHQENENEND